MKKMNVRLFAIPVLASALSATAADLEFPLDFTAAFAGRSTVTSRVEKANLKPGMTFEAWFDTAMPVDAHWFGAFLRKDTDRFSFAQLRHHPGAVWGCRPTDKPGVTRVTYSGVIRSERKLDFEFECRYAKNPVIAEDHIRAIAAKPHPRIIIRDTDVFRKIREASKTNEIIAVTLDHLKRYADRVITAPLYEYKLDGRRLWSQPIIARVFGLGQAWKIYGERKYLDRLERELRNASNWPDWNESHFIDTGLMTYAFAIAYDWFYDDWSEEMREVLANAILKHGLEKAEPDAFWIHNGNNWAQVCNAGMAMGSIAIAEKCPRLALRLIRDAAVTAHEPLLAYAPNGGYPEGVGYSHLATEFTVLTIETFKSAFGTDFGLSLEPGFAESGAFAEIMTGPSGAVFSHSDCGLKRNPRGELWWFAKTYNRPDFVMGNETSVILETMKGPVGDWAIPGSTHSCDDCFFPLVWMIDAPRKGECKLPLSWWSGGDVQVVMQTMDYSDKDRFWASIKGGCARFSHSHADLGTFVFDAFGERWAEDIGGENYAYGEKKYGMKFWENNRLDSPRWSYFRLGPQGHNVVTIDKENPDFVAYAGIPGFREESNGISVAEVELSTAYPIAKESARRIATMDRAGRTWTLTDDFRGVPKGTVFTWRMNTYAQISIVGKTVHLTKNGKKLKLVADKGEWKVFVPNMEGQSPAPGLIQLQLIVTAESDNAIWSVTFMEDK